jgi:hypothetical protein
MVDHKSIAIIWQNLNSVCWVRKQKNFLNSRTVSILLQIYLQNQNPEFSNMVKASEMSSLADISLFVV